MKKWLDYLIIPDCNAKVKRIRKLRAKKELEKRGIGEILIVRGKDSEEDIIYLGKILKKGDRIGIDTFPLHFKEYKELIKKAKRDGKFPKGVKVENIQTEQGLKLTIYGLMGLTEEKIKQREIDYVKNRDEKILGKIKNFIKKLLS